MLIDGVSERITLPWTRFTFFLWVWHLLTLISAHRQQFHTTTYIFLSLIMSSFLPEKEHMREALLFHFSLKKSAVESHRMLVEAYGDSALSKITWRNWVCRSKTAILTWVTRSLEIGPGRLRTINCRLFWTRTIPNRRKCLPNNSVLLNQPKKAGLSTKTWQVDFPPWQPVQVNL